MSSKKPTIADGYTPDDFNEHLVLKVPVLLALSILWTSRHLVIPFFIFMIGQSNVKSSNDWVIDQATWLLSISSLPALIVMFAWGNRLPKSGAVIRWLWRYAGIILASSLLCDILLYYWFVPKLTEGFTPVSLLLDLYILVYLGVSKRVRHVFADFPFRENYR